MHVSCLTYERVTSKGWRVESRTWPTHAARHLCRHPPASHEPLPGLYVHPLHPGARLLAQCCFLGRGVRKDVCTPCLKISRRTRRLQAQSPRVRSLEDTRGERAGRRTPVSTVFSAGSARAGLNAHIHIHAQTHAHTYTHTHTWIRSHTHAHRNCIQIHIHIYYTVHMYTYHAHHAYK